MGRYAKYIESIKKEEEFKKEQEKLHKKHKSIDEDKVIVERTNTIKFVLSFFRWAVISISSILVTCLTAIGILSLTYPNIRIELLKVLENLQGEIISLIGW